MRVVLLGCLAAVLVVALVGGAAYWYLFIHEAPLLDARLEVPAEVRVGEPFDLVIRLSNPHSRAATLDSVDVDLALMEAFQVLAVEPPPEDTMVVPFIEQRSWFYGRDVAAGQVFTVTFTLQPIEPGHYSGNVDVCNPKQDFRTLFVDIVVVRPGEPERPMADG